MISIEVAGELARSPIIGWLPHYGCGDQRCILPIALGIVLTRTPTRSPCPTAARSQQQAARRWYKDAKTSASAVNEAMAAQAWFDAGQPTVGGEQ